jgi:hypothetical protein
VKAARAALKDNGKADVLALLAGDEDAPAPTRRR